MKKSIFAIFTLLVVFNLLNYSTVFAQGNQSNTTIKNEKVITAQKKAQILSQRLHLKAKEKGKIVRILKINEQSIRAIRAQKISQKERAERIRKANNKRDWQIKRIIGNVKYYRYLTYIRQYDI